MVSELYVLLPGGASWGEGDIFAWSLSAYNLGLTALR